MGRSCEEGFRGVIMVWRKGYHRLIVGFTLSWFYFKSEIKN